MEVSNAVLKSTPCYYSVAGKDTLIGKSIPIISSVCFRRGNRFPSSRELKSHSGLFEDKGHLDYYTVCGDRKEKEKEKGKGKGKGKKGWNGVSNKKRMKLLKGLSKDLAAFSELGFGFELNCDEGLVGDDDKGNMISQAADILLSQLKQLRAEEEKMKKVEKQQKQKSKTQDCEFSSSSESSESSDSECDKVVDMNSFRKLETTTMHLITEESSFPTPTSNFSPKLEQECCNNMILEATLNENAAIEVLNLETPSLKQSNNMGSNGSSMMSFPQGKRVEVCMGGKCKKSGAPALMEEFRRVVGNEGDVVGCKCMGKCKSGPNVRVLNGDVDDSPSNPLCIGVGLEDVGLIVANYFGEEKKGLGLLAVAALHS